MKRRTIQMDRINKRDQLVMKLASDVVNETLRVLFRGDNCPFVGRGTSLEDSWKHMEEEYRMEYIEELTEAVYKKLVKE